MARKVIDIARDEDGGIVGLRCTQCGCLRAPDEFFKGQASHGRRMPCKVCKRPQHATAERRRRSDPAHRRKAYAATKRWHDTHPEYERARSNRRWRTDPKYRARVKAAYDRWSKLHPEYYRAAAKMRRAHLRGVVCDLTPEQWEAVLTAHDAVCVYCGATAPLTVDHLVPISKGGEHTIANVVPACKPCNSRKHNRELEAFFDRFGGKVEFCKRRTLGLFRLRAGAVNQCR